MSSSTLLTIKFSDDVILTSVFIRTDSNPEALLPALDIIFEKIYLSQRHSEEMGRGRLNWDYIGTEILQHLLSEFNAIMVPNKLLEAYKDDSIYTMEIKANTSDSYSNVKNTLKEVINVNYSYSSGESIFNGLISELSNHVDMKFHVKNKLEILLSDSNLSDESKLNMLADLMVQLLPYGKDSTQTFDKTDYGTLTVINNMK
jgi:hypothetical protein